MPAHDPPTSPPLAYFISLRTYGTWLHGDDRGSTDRFHNFFDTPHLPPDPHRLATMQARLKHPPVIFTATHAPLIEQTITEVCTHRHWHLFAARTRSNHVHVIVHSPLSAERTMNDFKTWITRRLREHNHIQPNRPVWTEHGSTPHLYTESDLLDVIDYVLNRQGPPLTQ